MTGTGALVKRTTNIVRLAGAIALGMLFGNNAAAQTQLAYMATGAATSQPIGHYEFCQALPAECAVRSPAPVTVALNEALWARLVQVNAAVNTSIAPTTDREMFGRDEVWSYPTTRGDCEDYVLLKRRMLIDAGWPPSALLITVVRKANGEGHAVLTVRTDRGDFVLDNLSGDIALWSAAPYTFLKRQSEFDSGRWVAIDGGMNAPIIMVGG